MRDEIERFGIKVYQFPECDSDEEEEFKQMDKELKVYIYCICVCLCVKCIISFTLKFILNLARRRFGSECSRNDCYSAENNV